MRTTHNRLFATILILCLFLSHSFAYSASAPSPISTGGPEISSASAVVMDVNTGALLYAKNAGESGQPSSLTKLVTAYIVLKELDMGSPFDFFSEMSHPDYRGITDEQYANRMLLQDLMVSNGFRPIDCEWWHFTLENEPFPDTYFDFPVSSEYLKRQA